MHIAPETERHYLEDVDGQRGELLVVRDPHYPERVFAVLEGGEKAPRFEANDITFVLDLTLSPF